MTQHKSISIDPSNSGYTKHQGIKTTNLSPLNLQHTYACILISYFLFFIIILYLHSYFFIFYYYFMPAFLFFIFYYYFDETNGHLPHQGSTMKQWSIACMHSYFLFIFFLFFYLIFFMEQRDTSPPPGLQKCTF